MRLFFNKLKNVLTVSAVAAAMLCGMLSVSAGAITGFGKAEVYSFCSDTESTYSNPQGESVESGALQWQLYDSYDSVKNKDGLHVEEGYVRLKGNNPLNTLSGFRAEIVYSSTSEDDAAGGKVFLLATTKDYTVAMPLITNSASILGIAENGDVYYKGKKINHSDGSAAEDILTAKNSKINAGDECRLTINYIDGKLTVTLAYNSKTVKLVENYQCEIAGLKQFVLGADKTKRLDKVTYKSVSVAPYGEYEPYKEKNLKAVVQTGEKIEEYSDAVTAMYYARNYSGSVIKLYSDMLLEYPVKLDSGKKMTVDLNGHTINRNTHGTFASDGYVFSVGEGASLTIIDSAPDTQNYSSTIRGGVITGGAGDDVGGGFQMSKNSKLTMTGGSVVGCVTNDHGGAIRVNGGGVKINISGVGFYSNMTLDSADNSHGGAIYSDYSDCEVFVKDSIFEGNYSEDNGGAVYVNDGKFTAANCLFISNKCLDDGGAVYVEKDSVVSFDNCVFKDNRADRYAGAVYCNSSDGTRLSGNFRNNSAGKAGGALFINGDRVSIQNAEITGNTTGDRGGAMYVDEMYDINIQGKLIVKNNYKSNKSRDDIFLDSVGVATARIYDGGLYEGSDVWVLTSGSSQTVCENISEYQQRYFHCDDSSKMLKFTSDSSKTQKQTLITSAIGEGNLLFIILAAAAVVAAAAATVIIVKIKKKGAGKNEKET